MLLARPGRVCLFCQLNSAIKVKPIERSQADLWPWKQSGLSIAQRRCKTNGRFRTPGVSKKESRLAERMQLPVNITSGPVDRQSKTLPTSRKRHGPFASMNRTSPPPGLTRRAVPAPASSPGKVEQHVASKPTRKELRLESSKKKDGPFQPRALKMQSALASVDYGTRSRIKSSIQDADSFYNFSLLPVIQEAIHSEALGGLTDISPTPIQRLAIPALLQNSTSKQKKQFLLAAETGSGKTLAYVLPIVDALKRHELDKDSGEAASPQAVPGSPGTEQSPFHAEPPPPNIPHPTTARPRAIVLVPTSELVEQIGGVFKLFSHTVKLRAELISTAYSATVIRNRLFSTGGIDIVVSTPQLLKSIVESDPNILSRVSHLVVDEADSLFDRSFAPFTSNIIDRANPSLHKLILCSATIPKAFDKYLNKRFPDIVRLAAPNLHAIPRRVQLTTVDIDRDPYQGNRDLACADAIWQLGQSSTSTADSDVQESSQAKLVLVFVNQREKSNELAAYLVTKGIDAIALHRDTRGEKTANILSAFTSSPPARVSDLKPASRPSRASPGVLGNVKVLVMTDLGSRGIDTVAVRNVVLYDVPNTSVDFIHRLGRTGRMGRRGRAVVLVGRKDRKDVVSEVRQSMFRGQALV